MANQPKQRMRLREMGVGPLVFPSILSADFARLGDEVAQMLDLGADGMHVDVMDGHFVDNLTMGPIVVKALRKRFPSLYLDVHLMVEQPAQFIQPFADAGANCLTFHIEATIGRDTGHERDVIEQIRAAGCEVGIALNPSTPGEAIYHMLDRVDLVLIMSVHPGFGGQSFRPEVLDKTQQIKSRLTNGVRLEMDGGLNADTIVQARNAGVDMIVAGSALFGAADCGAMIQRLKSR